MAGRTLTVLVADVVGSTALGVALGAERNDELRRALFDVFHSAAGSHDGVVVKTMGDGCLATFTASAAGVDAGLAMQREVARLARRRFPGTALRVGLAAGDVVEDDGDVFGLPVVLASRLCDAAAPGVVLASDLVRALAGERASASWRAAGALTLKGIEEPVAASEARADDADDADGLPDALALRPGEVIVGRITTLDRIGAAWRAVVAGERRVMLLAGEPGIGKTRGTAAEAARRAHHDGALVVFGRCEEGTGGAYQPIAECLAMALPHASAATVEAHVAAHAGELRRLVPALDAPEPRAAPPDVEQARLFAAVADLIHRLAEQQPVVLVLDDLHWAGPATVQMLRHLLVSDALRGVLVLGTYRDTEIDRGHALGSLLADLPRVDAAERLVLSGLDSAETEELVGALSDVRAIPESFASALHERTAGNPFFASQIVRHLTETGALDESTGDGLEQVRLPEGVLDVVGRRLSQLSAHANLVLRTAAVAGLDVHVRVLAAIPDIGDDSALVAALDDAVAARLLTDGGRGRYTFVHAIVREALLRELTSAAKARVHRGVGRAIQSVYGDVAGPHAVELAHHLIEAAVLGDVEAAAVHAVRAADDSLQRADLDTAIALLERAFEVVEAIEPLDHWSRYWVAARLAEMRHVRMDISGVNAAAQVAAESARIVGTSDALLRAARIIGMFDFGAASIGIEFARRGVAEMGTEPSIERAVGLATLASQMAQSGDGDPGAPGEDALAVLEQCEGADPMLVARVLAIVGYTRLALPQPSRAIDLLTRAVEHLDANKDKVNPILSWHQRGLIIANRAIAHLKAGDRDAFESDREVVDAESTLLDDVRRIEETMSVTAFVALLDARFAEARSAADVLITRFPDSLTTQLPYQAWMGWMAYEHGSLVELLPILEALNDDPSTLPGFRALTAIRIALLEAGRRSDADALVEELTTGLPAHARSLTVNVVPALLAVAVADLGRRDLAPKLVDALSPFSGELMIVSNAIVAIGAYDRFIGPLHGLLDDHDAALRLLRSGVALEERVRAPSLAARSRYWLGSALLAAGDHVEAMSELTRSRDEAARLGMARLARDAEALLSR